MELWTALQGISPSDMPFLLVSFVGVFTIVVGGVGAIGHSPKRRAWWFAALAFVGAALLLGGLVGTHASSSAANEDRRATIAAYLLDEHDAITLTPVSYNEYCTSKAIEKGLCFRGDGGFATATAVGQGGTVYDVTLSWLPLDSVPQDPKQDLPDGFEPLTVTITAR